jgi:hypothetical protein
MITDYILPYFIIGIVIAIFSDISIREMKTSEPFTFIEILVCVVIWPYIIVQAIIGFFDGEY